MTAEGQAIGTGLGVGDSEDGAPIGAWMIWALQSARAEPAAGLRFFARLAWIGLAIMVCVPGHVLARTLRIASPWSRIFLKVAARACGAKVEVIGTPLTRDVFFVANHLSWVDVPIIGGITGTAFVSQDKVAEWPVIGWLAKLNHTVFVARSDRMGVGSQVAALREALAERQPVTVFPEGTTTDGESLLPFKPPLFEVLLPPPRRLMIQPVLLDFVEVGPEIAWIGVETGTQNMWRTLKRKGSYRVRVHFLAPFDPGDHPHRKAIAALAHARIDALLAGVQAHRKRRAPGVVAAMAAAG